MRLTEVVDWCHVSARLDQVEVGVADIVLWRGWGHVAWWGGLDRIRVGDPHLLLLSYALVVVPFGRERDGHSRAFERIIYLEWAGVRVREGWSVLGK